MRILFIAAVLLTFIHGQAEARAKREIDPGRQSSGRDYSTPSTVFRNDLRGYGWTGRPVYSEHWNDWRSPRGNRFYGRQRYYGYRPGLQLRYNDGDWSAEISTGRARRYRYGQETDCFVSGYGYLQDSYCVGGRPVYVFGDSGSWDNRIYLPRRDYSTLYTAPDNPDYGYYRDSYLAEGSPAAWDSGMTAAPQVFNDNRVYNYYSSPPPEAARSTEPPAAVQSTARQQPEAPVAATLQRAQLQRFNESLKLETPDGTYMFAIRDNAIYAGLATGKPTRLSDKADGAFGGYAAWLPGGTVCLFYRVNDQICVGYPGEESGSWVHEPLPYSVRFGPDTSIGLVGGVPWLSFAAEGGMRYIVRYTAAGWEELGSGGQH